MFKIRLAFERLILEFTEAKVAPFDVPFRPNVPKPLGAMLSYLKGTSSIPSNILNSVSEIISICNYAIHEHEVSNKQLNFVRKSYPYLYKALENEFREEYL
ncbi:hypothetical protein [Thalassotalea marina]|uniref:DUF4145 domain-containing protein n=1 Tax=Thalassotalea marina TaxID=1673741 RepID=A0A919BSH0_9GAMM|nr:hypothetical protein [Thalassotalea marina]GHG06938.1 hypothetical protein GCM10017161_40680 [Thalassotalea marina]